MSIRIELPVVGMTCANCAATVERTLNKKVAGVVSATVNFAAERAAIEYDPGAVDLAGIAEAVEAAGFRLIIPRETMSIEDSETAARAEEARREGRALFVGVAFAVPLFVLSMGRDFGAIGAWSPGPRARN